jgi:hypothetical protein
VRWRNMCGWTVVIVVFLGGSVELPEVAKWAEGD